jgi:hypothetical protein
MPLRPSNVIYLAAHRQPDPDQAATTDEHLLFSGTAVLAMGIAFWSNAWLLPAYTGLAAAEAWSDYLASLEQ